MEPDVGPGFSASPDPCSDSKEFLNQIAAGAADLYERLRGDVVPTRDGSTRRSVSDRMDDWCDAAGFDNRTDFESWLQNRFDRGDVRSYLGPVAWNEDRDLPAWVHVFSHLFEQLNKFDTERVHESFPYLDSGEPIPFQEALVPLVEYLRSLLLQNKSFKNLFPPPARARVLREFLREASRHACLVLYRRFDAFRGRQQHEPGGFSQDDPTGKALYRRYLENLFNGEWETVFLRFPVLARNLSVRFHQRRVFLTELSRRLQEDWDDLMDRFGGGTSAGPIQQYEELGDETHHGGKQVVRLGFKDGPTVVYKPRPVEGAVLLGEVTEFLNERCSDFQLPCPTVVDRGEYGWQEWIEHLPPDRERLDEFYQKTGGLLACFYALCAKDIIRDNLIAAGTNPYPVDLECLVSPDVKVSATRETASLWDKSWRLINDCVLECDLLPRRWRDAEGAVIDLSGLGGRPPRSKLRRRLSWSRVNTNYMEFEWELPEESSPNLPVPGSDPDRTLEIPADPLLDGFRTGYDLLEEHSGNVRAIVDRFESTASRVIIYPTYVYQSLLARSRLPRYLRCGVERTILFDSLLNQAASRVADRDDWAVLEAEHRALTNLDVPYYVLPRDRRDGLHDPTYSSVDSTSVQSTRSGEERVQQRLKRLGQRDRERQLDVIRLSLFHDRSSVTGAQGEASIQTMDSPDGSDSTGHDRSGLVEEVRRISRRLRQRATRSDGCPLWLTLEPDFELDCYFLRGTTYDLYSGTAGPLVFFAAVQRLMNEPGPAAEFVEPLVNHLENLGTSRVPEFVGRMGLGGFQGFPSTLYGMATAGQLLARPGLVDEATRLAGAVPESALQKTSEISCVSGLAGGLLVFLKLHDLREDASLLEQAETCAERLLRVGFSRTGDEFRVVNNREHRSRVGFARGFSGVAWALARLSERVSGSRYGRAARSALRFDMDQFTAGDDTEDPPAGSIHSEQVGWFRGWPAMAVTSSYLEDALDQTGSLLPARWTAPDFETSGGTALRSDTLVRGRMGEALVYQYLHDRTDLDHYNEKAGNIVARLVSRRFSPSYRCVSGLDEGVLLPGLMEGLAGLGYGYLKQLDEEDVLPRVLFLE